jgi:hypothetical protein
MSALGMASLGTQCENKALGMASLGVFCGSVIAIDYWYDIVRLNLSIIRRVLFPLEL